MIDTNVPFAVRNNPGQRRWPVRRPLARAALAVLLGLAAAGGTAPALAQQALRCEAKSPGGDNRDFECPLVASGARQDFGFKANFTGSHDDTTASMTARLDGAPLACDKGSKTSLMGEDGEVSLDCRFSVTANAGARLVFSVALTWRHAQYEDFELRGQ